MRIESKALQASLKYVGALVTPKTVLLELKEKTLTLSASDSGTFLAVKVPCVVEKDKPFLIEMSASALEKAVSGRAELLLQLSNANSVVEISNKGYKAELAAMSLDSGLVFPDNEGTVIKVDGKAWAWLQKAVSVLQLDPVPGIDLSLYCKSDKQHAIACTFDHVQMAFARAKEGFGKDFSLYLPYDKLSRVFKGLPYDATRFVVGSGGLSVLSRNLKAFLPLSATEDQISLEAVDERIQEIPRKKGKEVTLNKEQVARLLENLESLDTPGLRVSFSAGKSGVLATCRSANGSIRTSLKGELNTPFSIDKSFLVTLVKVSQGDDIHFLVVDDAYLVAKTGQLFYVAGLQED